MSNLDSLRAVIRAQGLSDDVRRSEFQAIVEALGTDEHVRALASAELRGRRGYVVATSRRVFFAHAGAAGTAVSPVASSTDGVRLQADEKNVEDEEGNEDGENEVTLVFSLSSGAEVRLEAIPRAQAETFARRLSDRADGFH